MIRSDLLRKRESLYASYGYHCGAIKMLELVGDTNSKEFAKHRQFAISLKKEIAKINHQLSDLELKELEDLFLCSDFPFVEGGDFDE